MGKNVYAAPRKGPAGKWVEQTSAQPRLKDQQQSRQARVQALAAKYKKQMQKNETENKGNA